MSRPLRLAIVLAVAAAAVALAVAIAGGGEPLPDEGGPGVPAVAEAGPEFLGLVNERLIAQTPEQVDEVLDLQSRLRVGILRQTFDWAEIEREPGSYDFSRHDVLLEALARRGIAVLPVLFNVPEFRSSRPQTGAERGSYPPRRPADMGAFGAVVARRYGPGGSFWRERPELRAVPIRAWQVWNEPSLPVFWQPEPDARAYAELLAATAAGIREVDPEATIVSAGLPETRNGVPFREYVGDLYDAGGAEAFDVLAVHPYARTADGVLDAVVRARRQIDARGDDATIWVTEIGWASDGPPSDFTVGERGQAERIRATLLALARRSEALNVRGVVYFNWQDAPPFPGGSDFWGLHTGLLPRAGEPKPAFEAFERAAKQVIDTLERRG